MDRPFIVRSNKYILIIIKREKIYSNYIELAKEGI